METFLSTIFFLLGSGILFFVPGWILLRIFRGKPHTLLPLETFISPFGTATLMLAPKSGSSDWESFTGYHKLAPVP